MADYLERLEFIVLGQAVAKERPRTVRRNGKVRTYTPAKTASWEENVRFEALRAAKGQTFDPGASVSLSAVFERGYTHVVLTAWPPRDGVGRGDLDNKVKCIMDSIQDTKTKKGVISNDSRVVELHAYGWAPK